MAGLRALRPALLARAAVHLVGKLLPRPRPRVLLYHGIDPSGSPISVSEQLFAAHLRYLARRGYQTWPASAYASALARGAALPARLVVITFDDGYRNNIDKALPALERHGFRASAFVVTGNAGAPPRWEERDRAKIAAMSARVWARTGAAERQQIAAALQHCLQEPLATLAEWSAAERRGLEVASHTQGHVFCDQEPDAVVRAEITAAADALRALGCRGASLLAWPYGATSDRAVAIAAACGIEAAFLAEWSWQRRRDQDLLRLNRVPIDPRLGVFGLAFGLGRGYELWTLLRQVWVGVRRRGRRP